MMVRGAISLNYCTDLMIIKRNKTTVRYWGTRALTRFCALYGSPPWPPSVRAWHCKAPCMQHASQGNSWLKRKSKSCSGLPTALTSTPLCAFGKFFADLLPWGNPITISNWYISCRKSGTQSFSKWSPWSLIYSMCQKCDYRVTQLGVPSVTEGALSPLILFIRHIKVSLHCLCDFFLQTPGLCTGFLSLSGQ